MEESLSLFQNNNCESVQKRRGVISLNFTQEDVKYFKTIFDEVVNIYANRLEAHLTEDDLSLIQKNTFDMFNFHLGAFSFGNKGVFSFEDPIDVEIHYKIHQKDENTSPTYSVFHKGYARLSFNTVNEMLKTLKREIFEDFRVAVKYITLGVLS